MEGRGAKQKRSRVWFNYSRKTDGLATCNTCERDISCKGGCTSNMAKHLSTHGVNVKDCGVFEQWRKKNPADSNNTRSSESDAKDNSERSGTERETPLPKAQSIESPFTIAAKNREKKTTVSREQTEQCHRAVTQFIVKGLHPFATVESASFKEMISTLNPLYKPPTRHTLSNHFVPAWYNVEKQNVKSALEKASKVAITSDGWTSICQDHYLTVTAHYITQGTMQQKVLVTKAVYRAQTGDVVAEEIGDVLEEYGIREKVTAITVDNASNMDVAVRKLDIIKIGCFAHTLNLAAQTIYTLNSVAKWAAKIREVVVWMKRSAMAKVVLREKQHLLKIEKNSLLLDVKTRWNSLFLMIERFLQQYPALQAASLDPRLRKPMERDRLSKLTNEDYRKAEEFIELMEILYTSTLCASTEKISTCGQVLPILQKLKNHFTVQDGDSEFVSCLKKKIWTDLSKRYQTDVVRNFLGEATAMDPRFKYTLEDAEEHKTVWNRINEKILAAHPAETEQLTEPGVSGEDEVGRKQTDKPRGEEESEESEDEAVSLQTSKKMKLTPLEKLFAANDVLKLNIIKSVAAAAPAIKIRTEKELAMYKALPPILTSEDPSAWWWRKRDVYPLLSDLALSYLCVQASSTPSERVFSTAGDTISTERSSILPEKADMLIFLFKNC